MTTSSIIALIAIALNVAVVAVFLIRVALMLHRVVDTLGLVTFGVQAIALRTEPIGPVVNDINTNLSAVADALDAALAKAT